MRFRMALLCIIGATLLGPRAGEAKPLVQALLLGGGDEAAVAKLCALWPSLAEPALAAAAGFPRRVSASTLKGFKGGPEVAVVGYCSDAKTAELLRDLLRLSLPSVDLRPVVGDAVEQCPALSARTVQPLVAPTRVAAGRVANAVKTFTWEVQNAGPATLVDGNEVFLELHLRVSAGKTVIDEQVLKGGFQPTDRVGIGTLYTAELYPLGGRHFVLVREDLRQDIAGSTRLLLFGFFGTRIVKLGVFKERQQFAVVNDDWQRLRVYYTGQAPEEGDAYRFDPTSGELLPDPEPAEASEPR